jgi:hypothetical protein
VGVEDDTTMRDRRQPRTIPELRSDVQAIPESDYPPPMARIFSPSDLDLDDLAEAIRSLLGPTSPPRVGPPSSPKRDLLSFPRRVSHVVGPAGS